MENKKAQKLVDKIIAEIKKSGVDSALIIEDLKELRTHALEAKIPLAVKVLRLTYEHLEEEKNFLIPIPDDDPIDDETEVIKEETFDPSRKSHIFDFTLQRSYE